MNARKKSYFLELFKSFKAIIPALLFASVAMTGILASYEFGLFGLLFVNKHLYHFAIIAVIIIGAFTLLCIALEMRSKNFTFFDSILLAMVLVGLLYLVYISIFDGFIRIQRMVFAVSLLTVGMVSMVVRSHYFDPDYTKEPSTCRRNTIKNYYKTVISKYTFFVILAIAAVCICAGYLMFNLMFARQIFTQDLDVNIGIALLVPFVVYAVKSSFNKKINLIDAILLSGLVSIPVLFVQVFSLSYTPLRICIMGSVTLAFLILTFIRLTTFDMTATLDKTFTPACNCKCKVGFYYATLFKKFGFFSALAIASLIAIAALALLGTYMVKNLFVQPELMQGPLKIIPITVLLGACLLGLAFAAICALCSVASKKVCAGDYMLLVCLLFCILGFVIYAAHLSPNFLKLLLPFTVYSVILSAVRIAVIEK